MLTSLGFPTGGYRSKSWDEFAGAGAPRLDLIFTVCDNAASETCPIWPGHPMSADWGIGDPDAVEGPGQRDAFLHAFEALRRRIALFLRLPFESYERAELRTRLRTIGAGRGRRGLA